MDLHQRTPSPTPAAGSEPPDDRVGNTRIAELVARAKLGDAEAFSHLYRHYLPEVYGFAAARLMDRDAAEDVTQVVFFRAMTALKSCRDDAAFAGWLFAIARNVVADRYRARRLPTRPLEAAAEREDFAPTPEEIAIQRDDADALREARARCLNDRDRDLFDLLLTDLNDKQISIALGMSHGAVRTAHHRLLRKLRECLGSTRPSRSTGHGDV